MLLNVLANAIKYNHPGGRANVSFELLDGRPTRVRILVADTGIGIGPDHLESCSSRLSASALRSKRSTGPDLG